MLRNASKRLFLFPRHDFQIRLDFWALKQTLTNNASFSSLIANPATELFPFTVLPVFSLDFTHLSPFPDFPNREYT